MGQLGGDNAVEEIGVFQKGMKWNVNNNFENKIYFLYSQNSATDFHPCEIIDRDSILFVPHLFVYADVY